MSARQAVVTEMDTYSPEEPEEPYPLWSLLDSSSTRIAQLNLQLCLIGGNAGFAEVFGLPAEALVGHALVELVHPSVRDKLTRRLLSLAHGERSRFTDWVVTLLGARTASVELTGIAVTNDA